MTRPKNNPKRRRHGEGSIRYDAKRGLYVAQVTIDGVRKTCAAKLEADCVARLNALKIDMAAGGVITQRTGLTMSDVFDYWTEHSLPNDPRVRAPGTRTIHRDNATRWKKLLGRKPAAKLTVDDVERAYRAIARGTDARADGTPRKPAGVAHMNRMGDTLRKAVADGMRRGVLSDSVGRVVTAAQVPKAIAAKKRERRALTADEMRRLLTASETHRLHALFVLALSTGMRPGELAGLYWSDLHLDEDAPFLEVNRAAQIQANHRYEIVGDLKTEGSARVLELVPTAVAALREHRTAQNVERIAATSWPNPKLVFASTRGTVLNPSNVRREFAAVCALAGVARIVPNETRHSFATMLAESEMNSFAIVDILGHTDDRMLNRNYRKKRKVVVRGASAVMEKFLGSAVEA